MCRWVFKSFWSLPCFRLLYYTAILYTEYFVLSLSFLIVSGRNSPPHMAFTEKLPGLCLSLKRWMLLSERSLEHRGAHTILSNDFWGLSFLLKPGGWGGSVLLLGNLKEHYGESASRFQVKLQVYWGFYSAQGNDLFTVDDALPWRRHKDECKDWPSVNCGWAHTRVSMLHSVFSCSTDIFMIQVHRGGLLLVALSSLSNVKPHSDASTEVFTALGCTKLF